VETQEAEKNGMQVRQIGANERFEDLVSRVALERGWAPRKAKRFINSVAKKESKKFLKKGLKRRAELEKQGKLIDPCECGGHFDDENPVPTVHKRYMANGDIVLVDKLTPADKIWGMC